MSNIFDVVDGDARLTSGRRKVIITCAVTGSVHTPSMSEYLPVTPAQIAEQAIEAARAGAAILNLHARNPDGSPTPDPAVFDEFVPVIAAETDAIINITTSGGAQTTLEDRLAYPLKAKPELCSLKMGIDEFRLPQVGRAASPAGSTPGRSFTSRAPKIVRFKTRSATSERSSPSSAGGTAFASSSSATTSANCTISRIASRRASSRDRCSFSALWASSAAWGRSRRACS